MFEAMCSKPPCKNMLVNSVAIGVPSGGGGPTRVPGRVNSTGTTPAERKSLSSDAELPKLSSNTNATTFSSRMVIMTHGKLRRGSPGSSLTGIIAVDPPYTSRSSGQDPAESGVPPHMKEYAPAQLRNVGLFSHGGAGKTTLSEALLYRAGAITRMGSIDDGNTTTDFDPEELKRQMSVSLAVAPLEWQGHKINLLDSPGYADFYGEVAEAGRVADSALILVDGVAGPQVGTDAVWKRTSHLPRLFVVNKMDRENADYRSALEALRERYGKNVVPLVFPIGRADNLSGVVDLLETKAYMAGSDSAQEPPAAEQGTIDQLREMLVESACELDDELINKYLEGEDITPDELARAIHQGVVEQKLFPVLATAGSQSVGLEPLLNAIVQLLPSPADVETRLASGSPFTPGDKLAALIFKAVS